MKAREAAAVNFMFVVVWWIESCGILKGVVMLCIANVEVGLKNQTNDRGCE